MNNLESLVYGLPEDVQNKALEAGEKSDDCCTVYCKSIEVVEDYINNLERELKNMINTALDCDGWESFPDEDIEKAQNVMK